MPRAWERKQWKVIANGYGVSFPGNKNVLSFESVDGCTTLWTYYKSVNYVYTLNG